MVSDFLPLLVVLVGRLSEPNTICEQFIRKEPFEAMQRCVLVGIVGDQAVGPPWYQSDLEWEVPSRLPISQQANELRQISRSTRDYLNHMGTRLNGLDCKH